MPFKLFSGSNFNCPYNANERTHSFLFTYKLFVYRHTCTQYRLHTCVHTYLFANELIITVEDILLTLWRYECTQKNFINALTKKQNQLYNFPKMIYSNLTINVIVRCASYLLKNIHFCFMHKIAFNY